MYLKLACVNPEGAACVAEEDLGIQLEEWEGSEEKQDAPAVSAIEDSLLFESKNMTQWQYETVKKTFQYTVAKSVWSKEISRCPVQCSSTCG